MTRQFIQNTGVAAVKVGDLAGGHDPAQFFTLAFHDAAAFVIHWSGVLSGAKLSLVQATSVDGSGAKPVEGLRRVYLAAANSDLFHPVENGGTGAAILAASPEAGPPPGPVGPGEVYEPHVPFLPPLTSAPTLGSFPSATEYELPELDGGGIVVEIDAEQLDVNGGYHALAPKLETAGGGTNPGSILGLFIRPRYSGDPNAAARSVYSDPVQ